MSRRHVPNVTRTLSNLAPALIALVALTSTGCTGAPGLMPDGIQCTSPADCASRVCAEVSPGAQWLCLDATCTDLVLNGSESDRDCGGSCGATCGIAKLCNSFNDCKSGLECGEEIGAGEAKIKACRTPLCHDGNRNNGETDFDCGGPCAPCADDKICHVAKDCLSGVCISRTGQPSRCEPASCSDRVPNGTETDIDCGGSCYQCPEGAKCGGDKDCVDGFTCLNGACRKPLCANDMQDPGEVDIDCGPDCGPCKNGQKCTANAECASGRCEWIPGDLVVNGAAVPTCKPPLVQQPAGDMAMSAPKLDLAMNPSPDLSSQDLGSPPQQASCMDGVKNQDETGIDCGGTKCAACGNGFACVSNRDCMSALCAGGICTAPPVGQQAITFKVVPPQDLLTTDIDIWGYAPVYKKIGSCQAPQGSALPSCTVVGFYAVGTTKVVWNAAFNGGALWLAGWTVDPMVAVWSGTGTVTSALGPWNQSFLDNGGQGLAKGYNVQSTSP